MFDEMVMSKTKRIILNTMATYGRSVLSIFVGLFSSRWLLQGLGQEDLGLSGLISSTISVIVIFNTVMSVAVSRFYAFAIGKAQTMDEDAGLDEVRHWFNVALLLHVVLPCLIIVVGYPLGMYAIHHWLVIPPGRIAACVWIFRCAMVSTFISMVSVPYMAMFQAYQEIVELTIYGVVGVFTNFLVTFSLLYVSMDKLVYYGTINLLLGVGMMTIQLLRARHNFRACRICLSYMIDFVRLRQIVVFFFWEIFSCVGNMIRMQGSVFVINKFFGPKVNASYAIANSLSAQAMSLSNAMTGALMPAVTTEEGSGARASMMKMAFRSSKFSALLIILFSVPLIAEMDEVLHLWLINPPDYTAELCSCMLIAYIIDKLALGHHLAVSANGKIGLYHSIVGTTYFLSLPISILLVLAGLGPCSVGYMFIICYTLITIEKMILAWYLVKMPIGYFIGEIILPLGVLFGLPFVAAYAFSHLVEPSFLRVVGTIGVSLMIMLPLLWLLCLDADERTYVMSVVNRLRSSK